MIEIVKDKSSNMSFHQYPVLILDKKLWGKKKNQDDNWTFSFCLLIDKFSGRIFYYFAYSFIFDSYHKIFMDKWSSTVKNVIISYQSKAFVL